jgi:hypothetical protein
MAEQEPGTAVRVSGSAVPESPDEGADLREPAVADAVHRERGRIAADLRAVVVDALHRLLEDPHDEGRADTGVPGTGPDHARTALDALRRAGDLGGHPVPAGAPEPEPAHPLRVAAIVVATLIGALVLCLVGLVVVLLPGTVSAGPLLVVALAVAVGCTARHAPVAASAVVLAAVLGVLVVAAPFATTTTPATDAFARSVGLPVEPSPPPGACLLLGVALAAAYAIGRHRRRQAVAHGRRMLLAGLDEHAPGETDGRLGLSVLVHRTLLAELTVLAGPAADPRRRRVARHRLAAALPSLEAGDTELRRSAGELDTVLDEGRVAVLVAAARHAAALGGQAGARHGGRPPSVVVRGAPTPGHPEVGLLAARLLAELVAEVASRPAPDAACVSVEHREDAVVLEVASGRHRGPGARPGRVPAALAERAALLGGTVEVTSCREAISVRVSIPLVGALPVVAPVVAA